MSWKFATGWLAAWMVTWLAGPCQELQASTIIQTQGFVGKPGLEKPLTFNQFDPSTGTLQSVQIDLLLEISDGTLTLDNDGEDAVATSILLGATGQLRSEDVRLLDDADSPILAGSDALSVSTGSVLALAAENGDGVLFDPTVPDARIHFGETTSSLHGGTIHKDYMADFFGSDVFTIIGDFEPLVDFGAGENVSGQFDPVTMSVNVILRYEVVPEPSGLLLVLGGLLGIGVARRRQLIR